MHLLHRPFDGAARSYAASSRDRARCPLEAALRGQGPACCHAELASASVEVLMPAFTDSGSGPGMTAGLLHRGCSRGYTFCSALRQAQGPGSMPAGGCAASSRDRAILGLRCFFVLGVTELFALRSFAPLGALLARSVNFYYSDLEQTTRKPLMLLR